MAFPIYVSGYFRYRSFNPGMPSQPWGFLVTNPQTTTAKQEIQARIKSEQARREALSKPDPAYRPRHPDKPGSRAVPYRVNDRRMALEIAKRQAGIPDVRL
jgi:hypothetical protein